MPASNPARSDMDSTGAPFVPFLRSIGSAAGRQSASWRPRVFLHLRISAIFPGSSVICPVGNRPVGQEATKALADLGHYHPELGSRSMSDRVSTLNSLRRVPSLQFAGHFDRERCFQSVKGSSLGLNQRSDRKGQHERLDPLPQSGPQD